MAVDIGKRNCKACIMNADASVAWEPKYDDKLTESEIFVYSMVKKYGKFIAVCESTSNLRLKIYHAFEKYNIGAKLANPLKTKAIAEAKKQILLTLEHLFICLSEGNSGKDERWKQEGKIDTNSGSKHGSTTIG